MSLTVGKLNMRVTSPLPIPDATRDAWMSALIAQSDETLGADLIAEDEWLLIRRLPVVGRWRADAVDSDVGLAWSAAMRGAIAEALAVGDGANCVRYSSRRAAIADMLYRSALGEMTRQWAWQRMGLIAHAPVGSDVALEAAAALLLDTPELIWPVLRQAVAAEENNAALTALLRALPAPLWRRLLQACPQTAAYGRTVADRAGEAAPVQHDESLHGAQALIAWAAARPYLAGQHSDTLAILIAALAWPGTYLSRETAARRIALARARLLPRQPTPRTLQSETIPLPKPVSSDEAQKPSRERALPDLPETIDWQSTEWGGALFWLKHVKPSGALDWLERQGDMPADGLRMLMHALADALGVPDNDAVHRVFCGGDTPDAPPDSFTAYARDLTARWQAWLDEAAPELPAPRVAGVCRRRGRLRLEPGWIALHLPVGDVDTAIRRLALDLDPGWLPWLGCVVRICYDD